MAINLGSTQVPDGDRARVMLDLAAGVVAVDSDDT